MIDLERDAPDLEDLAAYLDGRLSGERRASVEERLLRDEDYYEVYLETVQFLQQDGQQETGQIAESRKVVTPAVWWRSKRAALLVVAATVVMAVGVWRLTIGPSPDVWVARMNPAGVVVLPDWISPGWQTPRSGSATSVDPDARRRQELAFRIGTRTVDLSVALAGKDKDAATLAAAQIELWSSDIFSLLPFQDLYRNLKERITAGDPFEALVKEAATLQDSLEDILKADAAEHRRYELGRWNEAGRLAAKARDARVLTGIWRQRRVAEGVDKIEPHLKTLETALGTEDFDAAEQAFEKIAYDLAGRG